MRLATGRERGDFLVSDVDPLDLSLAPYGVSQPIEAVTHDTVDALDPYRGQDLDELLSNCLRHWSSPFSLARCLPQAAAAPVPVQLSSHSVFDLVSEVTPFSTAPAVVLTVLAGPNSFASLRV